MTSLRLVSELDTSPTGDPDLLDFEYWQRELRGLRSGGTTGRSCKPHSCTAVNSTSAHPPAAVVAEAPGRLHPGPPLALQLDLRFRCAVHQI